MAQGTSGGDLGSPEIPVYYMKMRMPQVHARLGKMQAGQVVAMNQAMAARFLMAGAAEQVSSGEFEAQNARKQQAVSARQQAFQRLNQGVDLWAATAQGDVLTASDDALRRAYESGLNLSNLQYLTDDAGNPLDQDADIEDILHARANLRVTERFQVPQGGPQPLTPKYREVVSRVQQPFAPLTRAATAGPTQPSERQQRSARRARTLHGSQNAPEGGSPPPPGISPEAEAAAEAAGVPPPKPPSEDQKA